MNANDLTEDEKTHLRHALLHLEHNGICTDARWNSWYMGKRMEFEKRHVAAISWVRSLLAEPEQNAKTIGNATNTGK